MTRQKTSVTNQIGVRYDLAWSFPRNILPAPGITLNWWFDSSYPNEAQAKHRMRELEQFMRAYYGSMALYRVDFKGREMLSERLVHQGGKQAIPPKRASVLPMNQSTETTFRGLAHQWRAKGNPDILTTRPIEIQRIKFAKRKSRVAIGQLAGFVCLGVAFVAALVGAISLLRSWEIEKVPPPTAQTLDPARFDRVTIAVPNSDGTCDRLSFNNRTGGMAYAGKMDCRHAEPAPEQTPAGKGFVNPFKPR
jgi:hypothetical protein